MPIAATNIGATSSHVVHGTDGRGSPCGSDADGGDVEIEQAGHHRGADHRDEHGRNRPRDAREQEEHRQCGDPDGERGRVAFVEPGEERLHVFDEVVGVGREAEQLGKLADDDRDRRARSCSRPGPPWTAGRRRTRACRDRARSGSGRPSAPSSPPSAMAVSGSSLTATIGKIAAKISGDTDESGPSTSTRDGPISAYPTRQAIVVYNPVTGGRPASSAYAMPCGTRIAASTTPATRSNRSHDRSYERKRAESRDPAARPRSSQGHPPPRNPAQNFSGTRCTARSGSTYPLGLGCLGQLHIRTRNRLVRDLVEQVGDDVEAAALLVVVVRDEPRRPRRVGRREHRVPGSAVRRSDGCMTSGRSATASRSCAGRRSGSPADEPAPRR